MHDIVGKKKEIVDGKSFTAEKWRRRIQGVNLEDE